MIVAIRSTDHTFTLHYFGKRLELLELEKHFNAVKQIASPAKDMRGNVHTFPGKAHLISTYVSEQRDGVATMEAKFVYFIIWSEVIE